MPVDPTSTGSVSQRDVMQAAAGGSQESANAFGYVAWTFDPLQVNSSGGQANVKLVGVQLASGNTITGLAIPVLTAGSGLTNAQLGIYSSDTNPVLIASTASTPAAFQAAGWISLPLSAKFTVANNGMFYFASAYAGTTLPVVQTVNVPGNGPANAGRLDATKPWRSIYGPAQGTLPATITPAGTTFTDVPCIVAY